MTTIVESDAVIANHIIVAVGGGEIVESVERTWTSVSGSSR